MLSILIIDDEPPARSRMRRLVTRVGDCHITGEAGSASEALEHLEKQPVDVLLLDISMPGLDGMGLARLLKSRDQKPAVIFCTADPDLALDAFDVDALDYLLKPVRAERLQTALDKARLHLGDERGASGEEWLRSSVGGRVTLVALEDVVLLMAEDKYTTAVTSTGKAVINQTLLELENRYPESLLRVHRNALVARQRIRGLEKAAEGRQHQVILDGTDVRPRVSRRSLPLVRQQIREMA